MADRTERIVTETYSRETRRKLYDQASRGIDDTISLGKHRLTPIRDNGSYTYYHSPSTPLPPVDPQVKNLTEAVSTLVRDLQKDREDKETKKQKGEKPASLSNADIDQLKKAVAELSDRLTVMEEDRKKGKEQKLVLQQEKSDAKEKELVAVFEAQKLIHEQLVDQQGNLRKVDEARQEADRVLRDDVGEALTEHKNSTDEAIQELAIKVSDLLAENSGLRKAVDELRRTLESLYAEESEEDVKKPPSRCSSASSGSVAIVLPPAILTDGRRPSQAYHMHTLCPAEELADITAKKALEEATRISVSRI